MEVTTQQNGKFQFQAQQIELTVSALNPNAKMPLSVPYWEGPVLIEGTHSGYRLHGVDWVLRSCIKQGGI